MVASLDLPGWINAISVVALAVITAWYARSTHSLLEAVCAERAERVRELRRPVASLLSEVERRFTESEALLAASAFGREMDDISPAWRQLYDRTDDVADAYRERSERVYIELWKLRPAMQRLPDLVAAIVGDLRTGRDPGNSRRMLSDHLTAVRVAIDGTTRALELVM